METLEEKPDIKPQIPFLAELIALGNMSKKYKEKLGAEGCSSQPCGDKTGCEIVKQPTPNGDIQINDVLYNNSWYCLTNSLDNDQEVKCGNQLKTPRESEGADQTMNAGNTLQEAGGNGIRESVKMEVCQVTVEDSNINLNKINLSLRSAACCQLPEKGVSVSKNVVTCDVRSKGSRDHYHCNVSGEEFNQTGTLIIHKRSHIKEKPYKCDVCGKEFKRNCDLKVHKMTHRREKPYKCDMCGTRWYTKYKLQRHLSAHTGEKPYKCDVCGTGCFTKSNLQSHMKTHTGEKPYKCDICGKGFIRNRDLEVHKLTHTGEKPYKCEMCGTRWYTKYKLQRHMKTHTGEKPYKCDVCGTRWYTKYKLQRHLLAHTGEKPYKCDVCGTGCFTKVIYKAI